jgi:uncharacterized protein (TIGR02466 family)
MRQIFELFPTPIAWYSGLVSLSMVDSLSKEFAQAAGQINNHSTELRHSAILSTESSASIGDLKNLILPELKNFGALMFGEELNWLMKELWLNVMEQGGSQSIHNHANSFISGIIYLTPSHPSAHTLFVKSLGGRDFAFSNTNSRTAIGAFNAEKWASPAPQPGDVILFPSYMLHEVAINRGARRVTIAFNAVPSQLDSWGYTLKMS